MASGPLSWSGWMRGEWIGKQMGIPSMVPGVAESMNAMQRLFGAAVGTKDLGSMAPPLVVGQLIELARDRLIGRSLTLQTRSGEVRCVLRSIDASPSAVGLAVGQLGDVNVTATDVQWERGRLDEVEIRFGNVHVRPAMQPVIVAAPVEVVARVHADTVVDLMADRVPRAVVELAGDSVVTVGLAGHRRMGRAEVVPRLVGDHVRFVATAVRVAGRRFGYRRGVSMASVDLPRLRSGFRANDVVVDGSTVVITGSIPEVARRLSLGKLKDVQQGLRDRRDHYDVRAEDPTEEPPHGPDTD
jgi:hypothetical protein